MSIFDPFSYVDFMIKLVMIFKAIITIVFDNHGIFSEEPANYWSRPFFIILPVNWVQIVGCL